MSAESATVRIADRVAEVRRRVAAACEGAGRDPAAVTIVAVSKTFGPAAIAEAFAAGIRDFGENRVQEAVPKFEAVRQLLGAEGQGLVTHLVGHLQTNKVRPALRAFAILHAVDSERLLRAIATAASSPVRLMIEVNVTGEPTKYGVRPGELAPLVALARSLPNITLEGLMTVAPRVADPEEARPVFRELAALARRHGLRELSMGMTEDFEVAIEEGATHVRIGRAIFGERPA